MFPIQLPQNPVKTFLIECVLKSQMSFFNQITSIKSLGFEWFANHYNQ